MGKIEKIASDGEFDGENCANVANVLMNADREGQNIVTVPHWSQTWKKFPAELTFFHLRKSKFHKTA